MINIIWIGIIIILIVIISDKNKELNNYFDYLKEHKEVLIKITYFEKDIKKEGGKYQTIISKLKKIDEIKKEVVLENREKIKVKRWWGGELFHVEQFLPPPPFSFSTE